MRRTINSSALAGKVNGMAIDKTERMNRYRAKSRNTAVCEELKKELESIFKAIHKLYLSTEFTNVTDAEVCYEDNGDVVSSKIEFTAFVDCDPLWYICDPLCFIYEVSISVLGSLVVINFYREKNQYLE